VGIGDFPLPMQFEYRSDEAIECLASVPCQFARSLDGNLRTVVNGPSFAAPTITGIVALLRERFPRASCDEVRTHLARLAPLSQRSVSVQAELAPEK
jgi:hypothetical protein